MSAWTMKSAALLSFLTLAVSPHVMGLENGLARTPPMGWLSWERFQCQTDCVEDPENCISERLFKEMADAMVAEGYRDAGYEFINIDDCWSSKERDSEGRLQPDPIRFPSGIKSLADYVHCRELKLGIYGDVGRKTCAGYPGSIDHLDMDARTFAHWGADMIKMDGCHFPIEKAEELYSSFESAIKKTGRPMVYSCSWPAYELENGIKSDYKKIGEHCNLWRNYNDIDDSWKSVMSITRYYASIQRTLIDAAGPGRWSDPDMLVIGNFGLSYDQSKAQMALWAILAAPLLMSNDLRHTRPEMKQILLNKAIIAVNQDPLGMMGKLVSNTSGIEVWIRPVSPVHPEGHYSYALVVLNTREFGGPVKVEVRLNEIELGHAHGYSVTDLYKDAYLGVFSPNDSLALDVNPTGVVMVKAEVMRSATSA